MNLKHPVTGHEVRVSEESADFWANAGYRPFAADKPKATTPKRTAKKSTAKSEK